MSLKEKNKAALWAVVLANVAAFALLANLKQFLSMDLVTALKEWSALLPAGAAIVLVGLLNSQLSSKAKARLVFWRWANPMPGSQAFTKLGPSDHRVDMEAIDLKWGPLPTDQSKQDKLWYRLYLTVQDHPAVSQVHREFLLSRDIACLTLILSIIIVPSAFALLSPILAAAVLGVLVLEFLIATRSARVHGARFVCTVLALKGAGK